MRLTGWAIIAFFVVRGISTVHGQIGVLLPLVAVALLGGASFEREMEDIRRS